MDAIQLLLFMQMKSAVHCLYHQIGRDQSPDRKRPNLSSCSFWHRFQRKNPGGPKALAPCPSGIQRRRCRVTLSCGIHLHSGIDNIAHLFDLIQLQGFGAFFMRRMRLLNAAKDFADDRRFRWIRKTPIKIVPTLCTGDATAASPCNCGLLLYCRPPLPPELPGHTTTAHYSCHCLAQPLLNHRFPRHQAKTHAIAEHRKAPAG